MPGAPTADKVSKSRFKRVAKRCLLVFVSVVALLSVAELTLRGIGYSYRLYPEKVEFGWPKPTTIEEMFAPDPDLFWVPRVPTPYPNILDKARTDRVSLVFMGCSCTQFGEYDHRFKPMAEAAFPGKTLPTANVGCGGWSSFQGLQQLKRDVIPLRPAVIFVFYGWNDHWIGFGIEDRRVHEMNHGWLSKVQSLRLGQLLGRGIVGGEAWSRSTDEPPKRVPPDDFEDNLASIVSLARENDITPILVTAPANHDHADIKNLQPLTLRHIRDLKMLVPLHETYVARVRKVAQEKQVILCDLNASFRRLDDAEVDRAFHNDGIHFTKHGGKRAAEFMFACLRENNLLEKVLRDKQ